MHLGGPGGIASRERDWADNSLGSEPYQGGPKREAPKKGPKGRRITPTEMPHWSPYLEDAGVRCGTVKTNKNEPKGIWSILPPGFEAILWYVRSRVTGGEAVRGSICKVEANCGVIGSIG